MTCNCSTISPDSAVVYHHGRGSNGSSLTILTYLILGVKLHCVLTDDLNLTFNHLEFDEGHTVFADDLPDGPDNDWMYEEGIDNSWVKRWIDWALANEELWDSLSEYR